MLKFLREQGCEWDIDNYASAAENGHLHVMKWLLGNGCPWQLKEDTCAIAANNNHIEILKWAKQNGCPWDSTTCSEAAGANHFAVLKWAWENGCPLDSQQTRRSARWNEDHIGRILAWMDANNL